MKIIYKVNSLFAKTKNVDKILTTLYGPILDKDSFFLYFQLRSQINFSQDEYFLEDLLLNLQIDHQQFKNLLNNLITVKLIHLNYQHFYSKYFIMVLPPKPVDDFMLDNDLIKKLRSQLSDAVIEKILSSFITKPKQNQNLINIWKELFLPHVIKKHAKLRDFHIINKLYCENEVPISIWQKIIDFVCLQTQTINSSYIEKLVTTLKNKKIFTNENKLTDYFLQILRHKNSLNLGIDISYVPKWITKPNFNSVVSNKNPNLKKLFKY